MTMYPSLVKKIRHAVLAAALMADATGGAVMADWITEGMARTRGLDTAERELPDGGTSKTGRIPVAEPQIVRQTDRRTHRATGELQVTDRVDRSTDLIKAEIARERLILQIFGLTFVTIFFAFVFVILRLLWRLGDRKDRT
ncbi:hypothetical protein [Nitratireductor sp. XY-223]|uniref:hypothetical protein n=1 Tax=Nitratireductor sp. XY-223 TaxID=2561926 RepID=UPI00145A8675|nr:hypothetical protein [Nitratireductor sp. XY-223]